MYRLHWEHSDPATIWEMLRDNSIKNDRSSGTLFGFYWYTQEWNMGSTKDYRHWAFARTGKDYKRTRVIYLSKLISFWHMQCRSTEFVKVFFHMCLHYCLISLATMLYNVALDWVPNVISLYLMPLWTIAGKLLKVDLVLVPWEQHWRVRMWQNVNK